MLAFDVASGNLKWQYKTNSVWGSVAVDTAAGIVFTGTGNPNAAVLALNARTGQLVWKYSVPNSPGDTDVGGGIDVGGNGLIYANSKNGNVYAINETSGTTAWATTIAAQLDFADVSAPAFSNGVVYVGSTDNNLYALSATTGAIIWKAAVGSKVASSPAIANGVVYFASEDDNIYAVDATSGTILWHYATGALSDSSPIVVNGWLYCGSTDGKLYAFSL